MLKVNIALAWDSQEGFTIKSGPVRLWYCSKGYAVANVDGAGIHSGHVYFDALGMALEEVKGRLLTKQRSLEALTFALSNTSDPVNVIHLKGQIATLEAEGVRV